jgi:hypothetical protein
MMNKSLTNAQTAIVGAEPLYRDSVAISGPLRAQSGVILTSISLPSANTTTLVHNE